MSNVLIIADTYAGQLRRSTFNVTTFARQLIDADAPHGEQTGAGYSFAVLGAGARDHAATLAGLGGRQVSVIEGTDLEHYTAQAWAPAVAALAKSTGATHVIAAAGSVGKDLMPRVAALLGAGMAADVIGVSKDPGGGVRYTRPMWAGNVIATVAITTPVHVLTVRPAEFALAEPQGGSAPVTDFAYDSSGAGGASGTRFVDFAASGGERPDLGEAGRVVSGGRGLRDEANFKAITTPLADVLGAAIGATRAAVDSGFAPNDLQVGQTGRVVAPDLYIAIAISGAIQHIAGMKNSKCIVAINKDPDAPIFQVADYGLVADAFKAVPELVEKIKSL